MYVCSTYYAKPSGEGFDYALGFGITYMGGKNSDVIVN